jgi:DNA-binding MarR family transcriptional regulator
MYGNIYGAIIEGGLVIQEPTERLGFLIWHLSQANNLRAERALARLSLTLAQGAALRVLAVSPGLSSAELGRRVGVTAQSIKQAVDGLAARGLVERRPRPSHGRVIELVITDAGLALAGQAQDLVGVIEDELLVRLGPEQQASLLAQLSGMVAQVSPDAFPR